MSKALKLSGVELLIFSYIFGVSFDNVHRCYTRLSDMQDWFGITRQAVSRRIQNLVDKGYITKQSSNLYGPEFIKSNSYAVNMEKVTEMCSDCDDEVYENFMNSYGSILRERFPADVERIDTYIDTMCQWHQAKNIQVCLSVKQLSDLLLSESTVDIATALGVIEKCRKPKKSAKKEFIEKKQTPKKSGVLFDVAKPKTRQTKKNEWDVEKQTMTTDFVYMRLKGDEEILQAIKQFLATNIGRGYNPDQWKQQLENLYDYGITRDRMLQGIRKSYMNGYRSLYPVDNSEVDMRRKMKLIDKYVQEEGEGNEELKEILTNYIFEVPKGKSFSENQFRLALENLSDICNTTEEKLASVKVSYANSYSALAYKSSSATVSECPVDVDEKHHRVDKFIADGYYYLVAGLSEALHSYVDNTTAGKCMSVNDFDLALNNLRLFCLSDDEKVSRVLNAIQHNYLYFATEDYNETRALKSKLETRDSKATSLDHSRKSRVLSEKIKNPNDPRLKDVQLPKLPKARL